MLENVQDGIGSVHVQNGGEANFNSERSLRTGADVDARQTVSADKPEEVYTLQRGGASVQRAGPRSHDTGSGGDDSRGR